MTTIIILGNKNLNKEITDTVLKEAPNYGAESPYHMLICNNDPEDKAKIKKALFYGEHNKIIALVENAKKITYLHSKNCINKIKDLISDDKPVYDAIAEHYTQKGWIG